MLILETKRLRLRTWCDADFSLMCKINQDPRVMEYFPGLQDAAMTQKLIDKINAHLDQHGFSLYATERKDTGEFIGFIGLMTASFDAHFTPAIEIAWRLAADHWRQGFATEGALAVLDDAFRKHHLDEIVSFTAAMNTPSSRVMEKIGLRRDVDGDFTHVNLPKASPLSSHVLYRLTKEEYIGEG